MGTTEPKLIRYGTDTSGRPILVTKFEQEWLDDFMDACRGRGFTPTIVQGPWMSRVPGGGADASAGYHDQAGAVDFRVWDRVTVEQQFMVRQSRRMAGAGWIRDQAHGGMDPHMHVTIGPAEPKDVGLEWQWDDYLADGNGLSGSSHGTDYHWRPIPLIVTWAPQPKPTPNITAALAATDREERKRYLRRIAANGSPTAKRAAAAWLNAILATEAAQVKAKAARTKLRGLEVR